MKKPSFLVLAALILLKIRMKKVNISKLFVFLFALRLEHGCNSILTLNICRKYFRIKFAQLKNIVCFRRFLAALMYISV